MWGELALWFTAACVLIAVGLLVITMIQDACRPRRDDYPPVTPEGRMRLYLNPREIGFFVNGPEVLAFLHEVADDDTVHRQKAQQLLEWIDEAQRKVSHEHG